MKFARTLLLVCLLAFPVFAQSDGHPSHGGFSPITMVELEPADDPSPTVQLVSEPEVDFWMELWAIRLLLAEIGIVF